MARKIECLIARCPREGKSRGLCYSCYSIARVAMKKGLITEDQLVVEGMMLAKKRKGGTSFFMEQLSNLTTPKIGPVFIR